MRARSSTAAQTQPLEKATNPKGAPYHPLWHGPSRHKRRRWRKARILGASFRRLVRLLLQPRMHLSHVLSRLPADNNGLKQEELAEQLDVDCDYTFAITTDFCRTTVTHHPSISWQQPHHHPTNSSQTPLYREVHAHVRARHITNDMPTCNPCHPTCTASTPSCSISLGHAR